MEAKFLASALSFLSIFLAVYAQSIASVTENDSDESSESSVHVIYYGDLNVNIGQPFEITCIIPITAKVHWMKNGESITRHNLRHGRDDHSYTLSETAFEGEKHKIEAHLNVRHALKVHDGRYQCTKSAHNGPSHVLHVRGAGGKEQPSSTESGTYQTIDEMTPSSANEIFTKTWKEQQHQQQLPPHKQHKQHNAQQHNYVPTLLAGNASSEYGLIYGYEGQPAAPTSRYSNNDLTTPWHTGGQQGGGIGGGIHRIYSATPPDIPPPRFGLMEQTVAPPEPPTIQLYNQTLLPHHRQQQQLPHQHVPLDTATDSSASATTLFTTAQQHQHLHAHQHQQQLLQLQQQQQQLQQQQLQLQQQHQHTLNAYQLPLPPQPPAQSPLQPVTPPHHHSEKYQTYSPHFVPPALGGGVTQAPNYFTTGYNNNNNYGPMQQQPKTFLPIKKGPDTLVPNYDNVEMQMKFFEIRSPLKLTCNLKNIESDEPLIWKRENVSVTADEKLRGRFKLIPAERTFIIEKTDINDAGNYSCEFKGVSKEFHVISKVIVRVPSNTAVVEGEKMVITCTVLGYKPRLSWSIIGTNYTNLTNSTDRYILKKDDNGVENALLTLENVTLDDRGEYRCYGRNEANDYGNNGTNTVASDSTTVRVKGKFAALWPFLGICAEVIILCLIIFIYEKRRNKSELEESDTDPQEQKKKRRNYD